MTLKHKLYFIASILLVLLIACAAHSVQLENRVEQLEDKLEQQGKEIERNRRASKTRNDMQDTVLNKLNRWYQDTNEPYQGQSGG